MKAILLRRTGAPSVLEYTTVLTPTPSAGEVLVRADTIGVSMPETLVRKGTYAWMPPLPAIPGIEMSGTIAACGSGVTDRAIGEPVLVSARDLPVRAGCYAEYIAVPSRAAHALPHGCDLEAAGCYHLLHTASRGVEAGAVLVHRRRWGRQRRRAARADRRHADRRRRRLRGKAAGSARARSGACIQSPH